MMALSSYASEPISSDTLSSEKVDTAQQVKKSWMTRFLDYFNDANKNKQHKRFDFSVIGGPHYASDTKFGLGMVAAGLYRTDPNDSILPPSNVSLFGDVSSVGFYMLGVRGNHIAPAGRYRIDYHLYFYSFPSDFWGIGYEMGDNDDNKSDMKRWQAQAEASFLFRVADNFYVGPMAAYDYVIGKQIERPELLQGMDKHTWNVGVGVSLVYDNRDNLTSQPSEWVRWWYDTARVRMDGWKMQPIPSTMVISVTWLAIMPQRWDSVLPIMPATARVRVCP